MSVREKWTGVSAYRLRHEALNKRLLGYVVTLKPDQMDLNRKPELLNQCVYFLEIAMGDQDKSDFNQVVRVVKPAGVISRGMVLGIFESLKVKEPLISEFMDAWDSFKGES